MLWLFPFYTTSSYQYKLDQRNGCLICNTRYINVNSNVLFEAFFNQMANILIEYNDLSNILEIIFKIGSMCGNKNFSVSK